MSGFKDECGVFGIFGHPEASRVTYLGLYALQHRGQEAAGIVTSGDSGFRSRKKKGYVADVFDAKALEKLGGSNAIGHTRYSTSGESNSANIQPMYIECKFGEIAVCHNGNLVNDRVLRKDLVDCGSIFRTNSDTEVILHLFARSDQKEVEDALLDALRPLEGAFTLLFLTKRLRASVNPFARAYVRPYHAPRPAPCCLSWPALVSALRWSLIVFRFALVTFAAWATVTRPCSRHSSRICTESSGKSPRMRRSRSIFFSSRAFCR